MFPLPPTLSWNNGCNIRVNKLSNKVINLTNETITQLIQGLRSMISLEIYLSLVLCSAYIAVALIVFPPFLLSFRVEFFCTVWLGTVPSNNDCRSRNGCHPHYHCSSVFTVQTSLLWKQLLNCVISRHSLGLIDLHCSPSTRLKSTETWLAVLSRIYLLLQKLSV